MSIGKKILIGIIAIYIACGVLFIYQTAEIGLLYDLLIQVLVGIMTTGAIALILASRKIK